MPRPQTRVPLTQVDVAVLQVVVHIEDSESGDGTRNGVVGWVG
jgi:hypothetical protein